MSTIILGYVSSDTFLSPKTCCFSSFCEGIPLGKVFCLSSKKNERKKNFTQNQHRYVTHNLRVTFKIRKEQNMSKVFWSFLFILGRNKLPIIENACLECRFAHTCILGHLQYVFSFFGFFLKLIAFFEIFENRLFLNLFCIDHFISVLRLDLCVP